MMNWSDPRFRLAALQITFLCQMGTETDVRNSLVDLPDDLTKAYDEIYNGICSQKGNIPRLALNAFRWVKYSYEPLASKTLLDAVTSRGSKSGIFSQDAPISTNDILEFCQNFLILDEGLDVFRFAHISVEEYLETKIKDIESHTFIAETCLSLLCSRATNTTKCVKLGLGCTKTVTSCCTPQFFGHGISPVAKLVMTSRSFRIYLSLDLTTKSGGLYITLQTPTLRPRICIGRNKRSSLSIRPTH
jgi:hypothetical protein